MRFSSANALLTTLAAAATAATVWTFNSVFLAAGWIVAPLLVIAAVAVTGIVCRASPSLTRLAAVLQLGVGAVLILVYFTHHSSLLGFIPTTDSWETLWQLMREGASTAQNKVAPIDPTPGTIFLLTLSSLPVAIVVDECAFTHRPALVGLALLALFAIATAVAKTPISAAYVALVALTFFALVIAARVLQRRESQRAGQLGALAGVAGTATVCIAALIGGLIVPTVISLPKGGLIGNSQTRSPGPQVARSTDLAGQLKLQTAIPLLSVQTTDPDPYYLRAAVLEDWTPKGWLQLQPHASTVMLTIMPPPPPSIASVMSQTNVKVLRYNDNLVPMYAVSTSLNIGGDYSFDSDTSVVFSQSQVSLAGQSYSFKSTRVTPTPDQLRAAGNAAPTELRAANLQTVNAINPAVTNLVTQLTGNIAGNYDKTIAIRNFFADPASKFVYSLDVPAGPSTDPLTNFLTNRRGFCEQYASAMASMLRVAGVPARVAIGYTGGSVVDNTTRTVTTDDAHAWVEAYFNGIGWVPFDPTPIGARANVQPYEQQPAQTGLPGASSGADAPSSTAPAPPVAAQPSVDQAQTAAADAAQLRSARTRTWLLVAVVALIIVLATLVPAGLRSRTRRSRMRSIRGPDPRTAAQAAWSEITATATDFGHPPRPGETIRSCARRWAEEFDLAGDERIELQAAVRSIETGLFADPTEPHDSTAQLAHSVPRVAKSFTRNCARGVRARAWWLPATWRSAARESVVSSPITEPERALR